MEGFFGLVVGIPIGWVSDWLKNRVFRFFRLRRLLAVLPIDNLGTQKDILIRPSLEILAEGKNGRSKRGYTHSSEIIAIQKISNVLSNLPLDLHFDYNEVASEVHTSWILIGLSGKTLLPKDIYTKLEKETSISVVKTREAPVFHHQYLMGPEGQEFHCEHTPDPTYESRVTKDYGLIYRTRLSNGVSLLLCGGIHSFGTLAAVEVAFSDKFIKRAKSSRGRPFAQIVSVEVRADGTSINRNTIEWEGLPFSSGQKRKASPIAQENLEKARS